MVLDLDHSDDQTHGQQEFAFYNHHYRSYCYLPLFIFEGTSHALVTACLRPGTRPPGRENAMILVRLLSSLRRHWPQTHILVRGDSHFATPEVIDVIASYRWTDFVFGLASNAVLLRQAVPVLQDARRLHQQCTALAQAHRTRPPASSRLYAEFPYAAASWAQPWRVILKAEVMAAGDNPRFVVTSLVAPTPQRVYEELYCARGDMENRIKEQFSLFADRVSAETMRANQLRLYLSTMAYVLVSGLRRLGLKATELAQAQVSTIRTKLLKIGAQIRVTVRKVWVSMASSYPWQELYQQVWANLRC